MTYSIMTLSGVTFYQKLNLLFTVEGTITYSLMTNVRVTFNKKYSLGLKTPSHTGYEHFAERHFEKKLLAATDDIMTLGGWTFNQKN